MATDPKFFDALDELYSDRPELRARLGDDPARPALLDLVAEVSPALAPTLKSVSKTALVQVIREIAPAPAPVELVSFTTRVPVDLVDGIKARAIADGVSVQTAVASAFSAYLAK